MLYDDAIGSLIMDCKPDTQSRSDACPLHLINTPKKFHWPGNVLAVILRVSNILRCLCVTLGSITLLKFQPPRVQRFMKSVVQSGLSERPSVPRTASGTKPDPKTHVKDHHHSLFRDRPEGRSRKAGESNIRLHSRVPRGAYHQPG